MKKLLCVLIASLLLVPAFGLAEETDVSIFDFQTNLQAMLIHYGKNINISYDDISVPIEKQEGSRIIDISQDEAYIRAVTFDNSDILECAALFMPYGVTGKRVRGLMGAFVSSVASISEPDLLYDNALAALSSVYDDQKHKLHEWIYQKGTLGNYDLYLFSPIEEQQILVYCHKKTKMPIDSLQAFLYTSLIEPANESLLQNTVYVNDVSLLRLKETEYKATITIQNATEQTVTCLKYVSRGIDSFGEMKSIYNLKTEDVRIEPGNQANVTFTIFVPDTPKHCFYVEEFILDDSEIIEVEHPHIFSFAFK